MNAPQAITETIVLRLLNWAAWARTRSTSPVSCRSLERYYKSPQHWHMPELRVEPDILDALNIERGLVAYSMPVKNRNILVYAYLKSGYDFDAFCRKNRIRPDKFSTKSEQFDIEQKFSEKMLQNILARHDK